jgi:predicted dehydrogenase
MSDTEQISLGIIGVSEGNGHPYSFASVVNGYDDAGFEESEWGVIHDYLQAKDESEFGFPGVRVTHAWTQSPEETEILCDAANIPNPTDDVETLRDAVDAVILARDDPSSHLRLAKPMLEDGIPMFVDKPLTISPDELDFFEQHLDSGLLMSCSGMRYARELDELRLTDTMDESVKAINGTIIKDWDRYGMHLIDAVLNVVDADPIAVVPARAGHDSVTIEFNDESVLNVDALGDAAFTFDLDFYTNERTASIALRDNFTAFRRTLYHFIQQVRTGHPAIPPRATVDAVETLIAGREALDSQEKVDVRSVR